MSEQVADVLRFVDAEIERRTENGRLLASKFPELKGFSFGEFIDQCPLDLDFITFCEMYNALNEKEGQEEQP